MHSSHFNTVAFNLLNTRCHTLIKLFSHVDKLSHVCFFIPGLNVSSNMIFDLLLSTQWDLIHSRDDTLMWNLVCSQV
jgi:hypothetical protein